MTATTSSRYPTLPARLTRAVLDELYQRLNRRELIHPDPLEFLYDYEEPEDREIVGLLASSLAYGRVGQILTSVSKVLEPMRDSPARFVAKASGDILRLTFRDFRHRFTTGDQVASLLLGMKKAIARHGSLQRCFVEHMKPADRSVLPALEGFVAELAREGAAPGAMFLPSPAAGSACKRLHLFLRWMVRRDDVDPGGWTGISPSMLIVPLDTHMHRIGLHTGLIGRRQPDQKAAVEMTEAFRAIHPDDPVRYDFALTRLGIHPSP